MHNTLLKEIKNCNEFKIIKNTYRISWEDFLLIISEPLSFIHLLKKVSCQHKTFLLGDVFFSKFFMLLRYHFNFKPAIAKVLTSIKICIE